MTIDELTPEAAALLRSLINNPQPVEDNSLVQLLMADRLIMGSVNKAHLTSQGKRLLAAYEAAKE